MSRAPRRRFVPQVSQESNLVTNEYETFCVKRVRKAFGISHFTFSKNDNVIFVGTYQSGMFKDPSIHIERAVYDDTKFDMLVKDRNSVFETYDRNKVMISRISVNRLSGICIRSWSATLVKTDKTINLTSKQPSINENGQLELFFGGKMTVTSVKNCILIDDSEFEVIGVRKIEKDTLEIDGRTDFSSIDLFSIGVASFLSN